MDWVSALSGFGLGSVMSAAISGWVVWVNAKAQRRAELDGRVLAAAINMATSEWRGHMDFAAKRYEKGEGTNPIAMPSLYLTTALKAIRIAIKGDLSADDLDKIAQEANQIRREVIRRDDLRRREDVTPVNDHPRVKGAPL